MTTNWFLRGSMTLMGSLASTSAVIYNLKGKIHHIFHVALLEPYQADSTKTLLKFFVRCSRITRPANLQIIQGTGRRTI